MADLSFDEQDGARKSLIPFVLHGRHGWKVDGQHVPALDALKNPELVSVIDQNVDAEAVVRCCQCNYRKWRDPTEHSACFECFHDVCRDCLIRTKDDTVYLTEDEFTTRLMNGEETPQGQRGADEVYTDNNEILRQAPGLDPNAEDSSDALRPGAEMRDNDDTRFEVPLMQPDTSVLTAIGERGIGERGHQRHQRVRSETVFDTSLAERSRYAIRAEINRENEGVHNITQHKRQHPMPGTRDVRIFETVDQDRANSHQQRQVAQQLVEEDYGGFENGRRTSLSLDHVAMQSALAPPPYSPYDSMPASPAYSRFPMIPDEVGAALALFRSSSDDLLPRHRRRRTTRSVDRPSLRHITSHPMPPRPRQRAQTQAVSGPERQSVDFSVALETTGLLHQDVESNSHGSRPTTPLSNQPRSPFWFGQTSSLNWPPSGPPSLSSDSPYSPGALSQTTEDGSQVSTTPSSLSNVSSNSGHNTLEQIGDEQDYKDLRGQQVQDPQWMQQFSFQKQQLLDAGVITSDQAAPNNLTCEIHPLFAYHHWQDCRKEVWNGMAPALRLASLLLTEPVHVEFWARLFFASRAKVAQPADANWCIGDESDDDDMLLQLAIEKLKELGEHWSWANWRWGKFASIPAVSSVGQTPALEYGIHANHVFCRRHFSTITEYNEDSARSLYPVDMRAGDEANGAVQVCITLESSFKDFVEQALVDPGISENQILCFNLHFATVIIHNLAHAVEQFLTLDDEQNLAGNRAREPLMCDYPVAEAGDQWAHLTCAGPVEPVGGDKFYRNGLYQVDLTSHWFVGEIGVHTAKAMPMTVVSFFQRQNSWTDAEPEDNLHLNMWPTAWKARFVDLGHPGRIDVSTEGEQDSRRPELTLTELEDEALTTARGARRIPDDRSAPPPIDQSTFGHLESGDREQLRSAVRPFWNSVVSQLIEIASLLQTCPGADDDAELMKHITVEAKLYKAKVLQVSQQLLRISQQGWSSAVPGISGSHVEIATPDGTADEEEQDIVQRLIYACRLSCNRQPPRDRTTLESDRSTVLGPDPEQTVPEEPGIDVASEGLPESREEEQDNPQAAISQDEFGQNSRTQEMVVDTLPTTDEDHSDLEAIAPANSISPPLPAAPLPRRAPGPLTCERALQFEMQRPAREPAPNPISAPRSQKIFRLLDPASLNPEWNLKHQSSSKQVSNSQISEMFESPPNQRFSVSLRDSSSSQLTPPVIETEDVLAISQTGETPKNLSTDLESAVAMPSAAETDSAQDASGEGEEDQYVNNAGDLSGFQLDPEPDSDSEISVPDAPFYAHADDGAL